MISEGALKLYIRVLYYASKYHFVPHYYQSGTDRLEMSTNKKYLTRVYFNNLLTFVYTGFVISQYFLATELLEMYRGVMINALNLMLTIQLLINLLIFQNIYMGKETLEVWNSAYLFLRKFENLYKRENEAKLQDFWLYYLVVLAVIGLPGLSVAGTLICYFVPYLAPFITSIIYIHNLSFWKWFVFLVTFQFYIFFQGAVLIAEGLTRYYLFAQSLDTLVKEPRPRICSNFTKPILRTEKHVHHLFLCMKFLEQRINWTFGRLFVPAHLLIIIGLSIYANCTAVTYSSSSLLVNLLRKLNTLSYSLTAFIYIILLGILTDKFSKNFLTLLKNWKTESNNLYYKKALRAIPPLYLKIGNFSCMNRYSSLRILINILKYTGVLLIHIMKKKHVHLQYI